MRVPIVLLSAAAAAFLAACGSDEPDPPGTPPDSSPKPETVDELPDLPRGWEPHANRAAGFVFGRPPGWATHDRGIVTRLTAPDELVVVTITADRTGDAVELDPGEFARQTIVAIEGYERPLEPSEPRRFEHRYDASEVRSNGVAAGSGVRQEVRAIVIRRADLVVVTAVLAANASRAPKAEIAEALDALRTLRTRPVT